MKRPEKITPLLAFGTVAALALAGCGEAAIPAAHASAPALYQEPNFDRKGAGINNLGGNIMDKVKCVGVIATLEGGVLTLKVDADPEPSDSWLKLNFASSTGHQKGYARGLHTTAADPGIGSGANVETRIAYPVGENSAVGYATCPMVSIAQS